MAGTQRFDKVIDFLSSSGGGGVFYTTVRGVREEGPALDVYLV